LQVLVQEKLGHETEAEFVPNYLESIENMVAIEKKRTGDGSFTLVSLTPGAQEGQSVSNQEGKNTSEPDALQRFPKRKFQMTLKGRYETLIDFLQQLGRMEMKRLVVIDSISLAPGEGGNSFSPVLNITMPVTAYLSTGGGF